MRDYAKQDFSIPKRTDQVKEDPIVGFIACVAMGIVLGALLGYGLLYTQTSVNIHTKKFSKRVDFYF